jgi:hypothetical protein
MANKEHASAQCKYYDICSRDIEGDPADGLCILHSTDAAKDVDAFTEALAAHRERYGDDFGGFVFPTIANFHTATFSEGANFRWAMFSEYADFLQATFSKHVNFSQATFSKGADFGGAMFSEHAQFDGATFSKGADFLETTFSERARFDGATFSGRTLFGGRPGNAQAGHIFAGTAVDFRQAVINPPDGITFLGADLTMCQFLDTDLRKVQLVDVKWPQRVSA